LSAGFEERSRWAAAELIRVDRASRVFRGRSASDVSDYVAAVFFLALGIVLVWFADEVLDLKDDAILVAFFVVPAVLYLVLAGRVAALGAGSPSVTLNRVARERVSGVAVAPDVIAVELGPDLEPTRSAAVKTNPNLPRVATLRLGAASYDREQILGWLRSVARESSVPLLVVVDDRRRVLAYMSFRSALDLLENEPAPRDFVERVNGSDPDTFDKGTPVDGLRTETLADTATNQEALQALEETGLDAIVVIDRKGRYAGIVERSRVLSRIALALVTAPTALQ
jgi:CBS domain-containing protein